MRLDRDELWRRIESGLRGVDAVERERLAEIAVQATWPVVSALVDDRDALLQLRSDLDSRYPDVAAELKLIYTGDAENW